MKHLPILPLLAALAVLAPAGTAAAVEQPTLPKPSGPAFLVPEGKVEHSITTVKVSGTRAIPSHERTERWLARTHGRVIVTDLTTGTVAREITYKPGESRVDDARKKTVRVLVVDKGMKRSPWNAMSFEAAVQKAYIEQGYVKVVGEKTVDGRRALITENAPPRWRSDSPDSKTIAVVDAERFALYERTTFDGDLFRQEAQHSRGELVDENAGVLAKMAMKRPNAVGSVLAAPVFFAAGTRVNRICARRSYLFESPAAWSSAPCSAVSR